MSPAEKKKGLPVILEKLLALVDGVKGLLMIFAALSVGGASGTLMASDSDTVALVDSLGREVDSIKARQDRMEQRQMDIFTAQVESDSGLRAVLERRAQDKQRAAHERAVVENLINLGGTP